MDTVKWAFESALVREGITVTDHTGAVHTLLFRRNKDKNVGTDNLTFFTHKDNCLLPGDTFRLQDDTLIVLNCESSDNPVYRRCDCVKTNLTVDLCYTTTGLNEKFDTVTLNVAYANIPIYALSGINAAFSTMSPDDLTFIMPARYGLTLTNTIKMNILAMKSNHTFQVVDTFCKPKTIDFSNMTSHTDGTFSGILTVQATYDVTQ